MKSEKERAGIAGDLMLESLRQLSVYQRAADGIGIRLSASNAVVYARQAAHHAHTAGIGLDPDEAPATESDLRHLSKPENAIKFVRRMEAGEDALVRLNAAYEILLFSTPPAIEHRAIPDIQAACEKLEQEAENNHAIAAQLKGRLSI